MHATLAPSIGSAALVTLALLPKAIGAQCVFSQSATPERQILVYRFGIESSPSADTTSSPALTVTLEFTANASGIDTLALPNQWAGERLHAVKNLRTLDGASALDSVTNANGKTLHVVRHAPRAGVRISYELVKDWVGPLDHPHEFHPMIFADYLEMTGENALIHPRLALDAPVIAEFDWSGLPPAWTVATSFGTTGATGTTGLATNDNSSGTRARCQVFGGVWHDVNDALYAAGMFRVHRFAIGGKPTVLAIRGTWTFSDSAVIAEIQRDIGLARAFWRDDGFPCFLVTWAPFDRDHGTSDGTAFTNAIWIFMSRLESLSTQTTQLTHEAFHAWDPRRMGAEPPGEETRIGWFHEGVTSYYADLIAYRAGAIPLAELVSDANESLVNFAGSRDSYTRGDVIALWLDGVIRERSHGARSLDDVMHDMVREANRPFTLERVFATADRYLAPSDQSVLRDLATGAGPPPSTVSAGVLAPCVQVTQDSVYAFDAGFDFRASIAAHRVTGVRVNSAAYNAGLRDSQPLLRWSIYPGHSDRTATFTIQTDSVQQRISFLPRGAGAVIPQLHVDPAYNPRPGVCGVS